MDFYEIKDKEELLSRFSGDCERLRGLVPDGREDLIDFVPGSIPDAWSIREHLAHLADVEIRSFIRYRSSILASDIALVLNGLNVETSNRLLAYSTQRVEDSLDVIGVLRRIAIGHVSAMSDSEMEGYTIRHPDLGIINLKMILSIATQHVDIHIGYILRNIRLFNAEAGKVLNGLP